MHTLDVVDTSFGDNIGTQLDKKMFKFMSDFPMGGTFNDQGHALLGTPLWVPYKEYGDSLISELRVIMGENDMASLPEFTTSEGISVNSGAISKLISPDVLQSYIQILEEKKKQQEERLAAYPNIRYEPTPLNKDEVELNYLWDIFQHSILQQINNVLPLVESTDDRCQRYTGFKFGKGRTHLCGFSDATMDNSGHGPFQIDVFEVYHKQAIEGEIHTLTQYTISKVDTVTGGGDIRRGLQELLEKYAGIPQIS